MKKSMIIKNVVLGACLAHGALFPISNSSALKLNKYLDILQGKIGTLASEIPFILPEIFLCYTPAETSVKFFSEGRAKLAFWNAYDTVPAYRDFIDSQPQGFPKKFSDIPLMSKANYIKKYPLPEVYKGGEIPTQGNMDPSSGTSGRRTLWIRGVQEIETAQKTMNLVRNMFLGDKDYVLINMFLPSAWTMGLMRGLGPNIQEAYETLKDLGTTPEYLIMGHTTLMKLFVKNCPFDLSQYNITFLLGGEHMSRSLHKYFLQKGIKKVIAGYGASDIHFTVGIQEDFAQTLQEVCWNNPLLKKELTGKEDGLPYFFQYNPLQDYIEEIDGRLVFTDLDHTRVSPRVRYDLGDYGKIIPMSFVKKTLKKYEIELTPAIDLPLICLYGRVENTVLFKDIELGFDDLEIALFNIPAMQNRMKQYAYNLYEDAHGKKHLEFWIELEEGISINQFDIPMLKTQIIEEIGKINSAFKRIVEKGGTKGIDLYLYEAGQSPMLEESIYRKAKFVYNIKRD